ncbi:S49 family peptidase [Pseudooceanicola sp.]|uniref:S49 family peptidase n=1 Tax=Pseudooceanicola sp. TaxID=1914328 RepID=UPI004058FF36
MNVSALIGGSALAIHAAQGLPMLQRDLPQAAVDAQAVIEIERGQRFAVARGIAVVPVSGLLTPNFYLLERYLGWATYHGIVATMQELAANEDVQAIAMVYDTPGGLVLGAEGASAAIAAAARVKPVHALVNPLAASAGFHLASQSTDITLTPGSWVGSIGTMSTTFQPVQPGEYDGTQIFITTSTHADAKRPDASTDAGRALIQQQLDAFESDFLDAVARGRRLDREDLPARLSKTGNDREGGDIYWGADAQARGLVDRIETEAAFWERMMAAYAPKPRRTSRGASARAAAALAQSLT